MRRCVDPGVPFVSGTSSGPAVCTSARNSGTGTPGPDGPNHSHWTPERWRNTPDRTDQRYADAARPHKMQSWFLATELVTREHRSWREHRRLCHVHVFICTCQIADQAQMHTNLMSSTGANSDLQQADLLPSPQRVEAEA